MDSVLIGDHFYSKWLRRLTLVYSDFTLYLAGSQFRLRPWKQLYWMIFVVLRSSFIIALGWFLDQALNPSWLFIILHSSYHLMLYNPRYRQHLKLCQIVHYIAVWHFLWMAQDKGSVSDHGGCEYCQKEKKIHILWYVSFTVYCYCAYRSLVDQMDDARVNFVISNKKVSKVTVKTEANCYNQ
jgi:hypothetical protein